MLNDRALIASTSEDGAAHRIVVRIDGWRGDEARFDVSAFGFLSDGDLEPDFACSVSAETLAWLVGRPLSVGPWLVGRSFVAQPPGPATSRQPVQTTQAVQAATLSAGSSSASPRNPPLWCAHSLA